MFERFSGMLLTDSSDASQNPTCGYGRGSDYRYRGSAIRHRHHRIQNARLQVHKRIPESQGDIGVAAVQVSAGDSLPPKIEVNGVSQSEPETWADDAFPPPPVGESVRCLSPALRLRNRSVNGLVPRRLRCNRPCGKGRTYPSPMPVLANPVSQCLTNYPEFILPVELARHPDALSAKPGQKLATSYSARNAFIGSILAARLAGINPAIPANTDNTTTAPASVSGS